MQAVVLGHYVVVLGNTRYFHIAIRVGLESFSGRCRDAPGDFTVLTPDISSSLECRLFFRLWRILLYLNFLAVNSSLLSFMVNTIWFHLLIFPLSRINIHLHCNEW